MTDHISRLEIALEAKQTFQEALSALAEERDDLKNRADQIESMMNEFQFLTPVDQKAKRPVGRPPKDEQPAVSSKLPKTKTKPEKKLRVSELILKVLEDSEFALKAADIVEAVLGLDSDLDETSIHGAIHRLKKNDRLVVQGTPKNFSYSVAA